MTQQYKNLYNSMVRAARDAVKQCKPTPMVVFEANGLTNEPKPGGNRYYVKGGVCGFAWVKFKGNTAFARWAKKNNIARADYPSGLSISAFALASEIGQSLERGEAAARAAAKVLQEAGVEAYAQSRID